jgi:hypothetical protein
MVVHAISDTLELAAKHAQASLASALAPTADMVPLSLACNVEKAYYDRQNCKSTPIATNGLGAAFRRLFREYRGGGPICSRVA